MKSTTTTIVRGLLSMSIIPGIGMTCIGLGLLPIDDKFVIMSTPFIQPLGIPTKVFACILGPCKILGCLALWNIGPMPEWFARFGLMFAAACGSYGHTLVGESPAPPLGYIGLMLTLYALENVGSKKGKKE